MLCHCRQTQRKVFDVNGQSTANGAGILQWQYSGNTNQNWQFSLL
ncbi:RICIN domain-containing protein [Pseudarcicella hirudinis]